MIKHFLIAKIYYPTVIFCIFNGRLRIIKIGIKKLPSSYPVPKVFVCIFIYLYIIIICSPNIVILFLLWISCLFLYIEWIWVIFNIIYVIVLIIFSYLCYLTCCLKRYKIKLIKVQQSSFVIHNSLRNITPKILNETAQIIKDKIWTHSLHCFVWYIRCYFINVYNTVANCYVCDLQS